jgi:hypothetical protein
MWKRAVIVSLCLVLGSVLIARASKTERVPARQSFATFPMDIDSWKGQVLPLFDEQVLAQLRVDEYVNRVYYSEGAPSGVGLYIGYYETQRQGETMHSPMVIAKRWATATGWPKRKGSCSPKG